MPMNTGNGIKFSFYAPRTCLLPFVRHYLIVRTNDEGYSSLTFPTGCPQLVFHRKNLLFIPELQTTQPRFAVSGQVNFPATLQSSGIVEMIVVVFKPQAAPLFNIPIAAVYNQEIPGSDLEDKGLTDLADSVFNAISAEDAVHLIERWLLSRLDEGMMLDFNRISASLNLLFSCRTAKVTNMADAACLGKRQFERVFRNVVGMSPKEYARITRFHKSLWLMQNGSKNFAGIAFRSGYSDQLHFIREFKEYSGMTPLQLAAIQPVFSDLFSPHV